MSQRLTVLQYLRQAGDRGVTNGFFADKHILRYSARVHELRDLGFIIRTEKQAGSKVRFILLSEPDPEQTIGEKPPPPADGLLSAEADIESGRGEGSPDDGLLSGAQSSSVETGHSTVALSAEPEQLFETPTDTPHWKAA